MPNTELQPNGQNSMSNKIKRIPNEGIFMSVTKKAEKITTAIYMLTDFIPEADPMRHKIRGTTLGILSDTRALSYSLTGDIYFHLGKVISKGFEVLSLIEVSVAVGFISDMNYMILKNALVEFIGDLRNRQRVEGFKNIQDLKFNQGSSGNFLLKSDFFKLNDEDLGSMKEESFEVKTKKVNTQPRPEIHKGHSLEKMSDRKPSVSLHPKEREVAPMNERKDKILELIKEKKEISIKDIVSYFKEYSQKTIQRDLASLVDAGNIKRTGEKRWSRYSTI